MTETIVVAIIGGIVSLAAASWAGIEARRARIANRSKDLEQSLARQQLDNNRLWFWNRQLVDHIYRGNPPPPPPPPPGIFEK